MKICLSIVRDNHNLEADVELELHSHKGAPNFVYLRLTDSDREIAVDADEFRRAASLLMNPKT